MTEEPTRCGNATETKSTPSAHFSLENNIEHECIPQDLGYGSDDAEAQVDAHHTDETTNSQAFRRASHRVSCRRESTTGIKPFDVSYHPGQLILYCAPKQRQRWGDDQVLPRVNWGDLFFDLFYGTWNVTSICIEKRK